MATITVTNLNDSGAGSLRQALADAEAQAGADTIVFDEGLSGGTIRLASLLRISTGGEIFVQGDIDGDDVPDITISGDTDGDGTGDVNLLNNGATSGGAADITFNGFRFDKGFDDRGYSYIISNGPGDKLTLSNSYITESVVTAPSGLHATIFNNGDITIENVLIENATVNTTTSTGVAGLLSQNLSTATIDRLGVTGTATNDGGAYAHLGIIAVGSINGGILAIGDGDTGDDGTGLAFRGPGSGSVDLGVAGTTGADALNFSSATTQQIVLGFGGGDDIDVGSANDMVFGGAGDDDIDGGSGDDMVLGENGSDTLTGGEGDDTLSGGAGNDTLDGGADNDTADFSDATSETLAILLNREGIAQSTLSSGRDTFIGIENLIGSDFNDRLFGDENANRIEGGDGGDTLDGVAGDDSLFGGAGNDGFRARGGTDLFDGGDDTDFVNYTASSGVNAFLDGSGTNGRAAVGDTFVDVENLIGSATGNDLLFGDEGANRLTGLGGNDLIRGRAGVDQLEGGAGDDMLIGDEGADVIVTGTGADTIVFNNAPNTAERDRITDFESGSDILQIDASVFGGGLVAGQAAVLVANGNPVADTGDATFLYDTDSGLLRFDADGNAAGAAVLFAFLQNVPTIDAGDFEFV